MVVVGFFRSTLQSKEASNYCVEYHTLVWGEEGVMQDGGVCLERGIRRDGSLPDD